MSDFNFTIDMKNPDDVKILQALLDLNAADQEEINARDIEADSVDYEQAYTPIEIMRLAGVGVPQLSIEDDVTEEENDETLNRDTNKVNDGDSDGRGYEYGDDAYKLFGNEKQKVGYVPARSGDNAIEEKSFANYFTEVQKKNG